VGELIRYTRAFFPSWDDGYAEDTPVRDERHGRSVKFPVSDPFTSIGAVFLDEAASSGRLHLGTARRGSGSGVARLPPLPNYFSPKEIP
jgi:hypothetical protein